MHDEPTTAEAVVDAKSETHEDNRETPFPFGYRLRPLGKKLKKKEMNGTMNPALVNLGHTRQMHVNRKFDLPNPYPISLSRALLAIVIRVVIRLP